MIRYRGDEARDTKEVAFDYEEQWERAVFQKTQILLTAHEEPLSPLSSESITPPASYRVSPPTDERQKMPRVGPSHGEISPYAQGPVPVPVPLPPRMERDTTNQTEVSLPSAVLVLPPIQQEVPSKQAQGQKPTPECEGGFTCRLKDCCYHDRPKEGECACDSELPPLRRTTDLELKRLLAAPSKPDAQVPYRPRGGFITDGELEPVRTGVRPVSNMPRPASLDGGDTSRTSGTESRFLHCRQDTAISRQGGEVARCADMSLEFSVHTAGSVHVVRYTYTHVQSSKLPPLSARLPSPPNLSKDRRESRNGSPRDPHRKSSATGRTPSSRQSSWKQF
ncbi:uncharacterized protein AB9X84_018380 [Acanthopagrus schlegelii]